MVRFAFLAETTAQLAKSRRAKKFERWLIDQFHAFALARASSSFSSARCAWMIQV
jgi:hypothetical protein